MRIGEVAGARDLQAPPRGRAHRAAGPSPRGARRRSARCRRARDARRQPCRAGRPGRASPPPARPAGAGVRRPPRAAATAAAPTSSCERVRPGMRAILAGVSCGGCPRSPHSRTCASARGRRASASSSTVPCCASRDGFTRRANSARVDGGGGDLGGLMTRAEREYRSRGLRPGIPAHAAHAAGLRAAAARARLRRRHRGGRDGGRGRCRCRRAAGGPATGSRSRPELDEEWLRVFQAVERNWPAEQDPGARWVLGSGDVAAPLRARARRR